MTEINKLNDMTIDELMAYVEDSNITLEINNGTITNIVKSATPMLKHSGL